MAAVCPSAGFSALAVTDAAAVTSDVVGVGVGGGVVDAAVNARISARPTFCVLLLTEVTVKRAHVTDRAGNVTCWTAPAFGSAGTVTLDPSENVSVPPVTWSSPFGRSARSMLVSDFADAHESCSQVPARPFGATHSADGFAG